MEKVFRGSKYFEDEVASLRQAVSDYLNIGVCVTYNKRGVTTFRQNYVIEGMCKEIAKQRGIPFITVYWYMENLVIVRIPNLQKTQPLFSHALLIGSKFEGRLKIGYHASPVEVDKAKSRVTVYYQNEKGMEALRAWMNSVQNESKLRFILGLPPKVTASRP